MNNRRIVAGLAAMGAVASMNLLVACTPSDDNDAFATPTPAQPDPEIGRFCQIIWANQNADDLAALDVFVVEGPAELWLNGAEAGADGDFTRYYEEGVVLDGGIYVNSAPIALVTSGTFDITLNLGGTSEGSPVRYDDTTADTLLGYDTAGAIAGVIGSGGNGSFAGTWSDPASPSFTVFDDGECDNPATGLATETCEISLFIGTAQTLVGSFGSYASCFDVVLE